MGLVDDLAYEDELDDVADVALDAEIEVEDYARVTWEALGVSRRARIAVVNAVGTMVSGESGFDPINGPVLGSDSLVEQIREARGQRRESARAANRQPGRVVGRLGRDLARADDHEGQGLPVIVSMSDLAASGGYYMAAAGDVIVAQPGTLTGSIGVYTGKFVTGGTFEKLGANIETVQQGEIRRHVFARPAVHPGRADQGARVDAGHLRSLRRARRRRRGRCRPRRWIRSARGGCGPAARPARSAWSMSSAG